MEPNAFVVAESTASLLTARRTGVPQPLPTLREADTDAQADTAYAVQAAVARALGWFDGGVPLHWKSGGAHREAVLTHAPLPPSGVCSSPADLRAVPFAMRGIEAEVALRIGEPVDAARAASGQPLALAEMCVAIEVVDSRWAQGLQAPPWAKLADLQSHGALVLGRWTPFMARNWATQRVQVNIQGAVQTFTGTHAFGDPAWGLTAWARHATRHGDVLPAGTVVTTGTWCGLLPAQPGDAVSVSFDGVGEVCLQL